MRRAHHTCVEKKFGKTTKNTKERQCEIFDFLQSHGVLKSGRERIKLRYSVELKDRHYKVKVMPI